SDSPGSLGPRMTIVATTELPARLRSQSSRIKVTSIFDRYSVTLPFSIWAVCSRTRMPVRLRSVLFARFSASPTASYHPFGEDPIIVVARATAIAHPVSRLCGSGGQIGGSRVAAEFGVVKNAAAGPPMGQSEKGKTDMVVEQRVLDQRGQHLRAHRPQFKVC